MQKSVLDKIEKVFHGYEEIGNRHHLNTASNFLNHFLTGDGSRKQMNRDEARQFNFIKEAESVNKKRFEASLGKHHSGLGQKLKKLKNGQSIDLEDYWDFSVRADSINPKKNILITDGADGFFSFGKTNVKSTGRFKATRNGNKIDIKGDVDHDWSDIYDFDERNILGGAGGVALENADRAKSFPFGASWKQEVRGEIHINNKGRLSRPSFEWKDE